MKRPVIILFFALLFGAFQPGFAQEKIYMPYFETINMHEDYQYSTSKLFKDYVEHYGRYEIVLPARPEGLIYLPPREKVKEIAASVNANYYIMGSLNTLDEIVVVKIAMYETATGEKVWSDMLKAEHPDDLDAIFTKLAKNIGKKTSEGDDIYSISEYESHKLNKIEAEMQLGVSIGSMAWFNGSADDNISGGFGGLLSLDARSMMYDIRLDLYFGGYDFYSIGISALKPFNPTKNTFYAGGGLNYGIGRISEEYENRYGYMEYNFEENNGIMFYGAVGYLFNRTSSVHFRINAQPYITTYKLAGEYQSGLLLNAIISF